jgi:hypothetical protein
MRALVVGGASCVWDDLAALGLHFGPVLVVNDIGTVHPGRIDHWCTLHAEKLESWRLARWRNGGNGDYTTWGRPEKPGTDRTLAYWTRGSSGLFAVGVALELGAHEVVLCGVPMDGRPHYFDSAAWDSFRLYRETWVKRAPLLWERGVYSMSGWTRELLGPPPTITERKEAA